MVRLHFLDVALPLGIWVSGAFASCLLETSGVWQVSDSASATALAAAVGNCSGESFHVEWTGTVPIDRTVSIQDGTALYITGVGSGAGIDGRLENRLFSVRNASLHVSNMNLSNGNASRGAGGAVDAAHSTLIFNQTMFTNNVADEGGAIYAVEGSSVVWEVSSLFEANVAYYGSGGAVLASGADLTWKGSATFTGNLCKSDACTGGAVLAKDEANTVFEGLTFFSNNAAMENGGAVMVESGASVSFAAGSTFMNNHARAFGGGVCLENDSTISWETDAVFFGNSAGVNGGATHVVDDSSATWKSRTNFTKNIARGFAGAVSVSRYSDASWGAETYFAENTAGGNGGAVLVLNGSSISFAAPSAFIQNSANIDGGAVIIGYGSTVIWNDNVEFRYNHAGSNGGAIGSFTAENTEDVTSLTFNGTTTVFANNSCEESGGAMVAGGSLSPISFGTSDVIFANNSAGNSGGALFISGVGIGMQISGARFLSNSAQVGGAVYSTGSGLTRTTIKARPMEHPTTFSACDFIGNRAGASGGAVESAAGLDDISDSTFVHNTARIGGALRLAGTAYLNNCSFVENSSAEEGPAVSNIGNLKEISGNSFGHNAYQCGEGYFLAFTPSGDLFETVCDGCGTNCTRCSFEGEIPYCTEVLDHTKSSGGSITIDELLIDKGYWRATAISESVLACFNTNACLGGDTGGTGYCHEGYEGPYCSVCGTDYTKSLSSFTCTKCTGFGSGEIAIAIAISVLVLPVFASLVVYLVSADFESGKGRLVTLVTRRVPIQSVKIVIVVWQILSQFVTIANIIYPGAYDSFMGLLDVITFDPSWLMSTGCLFDLDFHDRLLVVTMGPIVCLAILGVTYSIAVGRVKSPDALFLGKARQRHLSAVILLTFLIYSSVSSVLFQMFACENLDDGKRYLRADYRIECDSSKHQVLQVYAGFMFFLYPAGIPVFYTALLLKNRHLLTGGKGRDYDERVRSTSVLWQPYKPGAFFYEVVECVRRILLTGAVVFIYPNTAAQIAIPLLIAVLFVFVSEIFAPYASQWDTWLSRAGHAIVFTSLYLALLLKVDVSNESGNSQRVFGAMLVAAHAGMAAAVFAEAVVMYWSLRPEEAGDALATMQPCVDLSVLMQARETKSDTPKTMGWRKPDPAFHLTRVPHTRNVLAATAPAYTVDGSDGSAIT